MQVACSSFIDYGFETLQENERQFLTISIEKKCMEIYA